MFTYAVRTISLSRKKSWNDSTNILDPNPRFEGSGTLDLTTYLHEQICLVIVYYMLVTGIQYAYTAYLDKYTGVNQCRTGQKMLNPYEKKFKEEEKKKG